MVIIETIAIIWWNGLLKAKAINDKKYPQNWFLHLADSIM